MCVFRSNNNGKKVFQPLMMMVGSARNNYNEQKAELEFSMLSYRKKERKRVQMPTNTQLKNV